MVRLRFCISILALAALGGCGGPFLVFPGGELRGTVVDDPVEDWSFVTDRFVDLETRPAQPYSIELNYIVRDGQLYIDPAEGRRWLDYIRADARVRARFGDKIYPLKAVLVGHPGELEGFPEDRFIYRLDPRPTATIPSAARAEEDEQHVYFSIVPGRFALIGQAPDGGPAYQGTAEITDRNGRFHLVKRIDGKETTAKGIVERATIGERDVVRLRWPGHAETCMVGSDLDNYSRLTCYWTVDAAEHEQPGLEAYFPTATWP